MVSSCFVRSQACFALQLLREQGSPFCAWLHFQMKLCIERTALLRRLVQCSVYQHAEHNYVVLTPGPKAKEDPSLPHSFTPLESGVRAATNDQLQQPSPTSQPTNDFPGASQPGSTGQVGHLSQAISEHLACATGGSGQATTPADVSPQDFKFSNMEASSVTSEDAHAALGRSSAMQQHDSSPARVTSEAFQQHADEGLLHPVPAADQSTGHADLGQQVHQRPVMETPSSKRHKAAEPSLGADTSSSELNLADFGLSSTPVWQGTPDGQQANPSTDDQP